ncbi:hypothetical protein RI543_003368 [Arxiozyma heterogenica]|uniref:MSP domain-containing protein n=1 Tax=Arxiozyma heterogenica TaxID=278026 RepID=A0AAN8A6V3_9SACH|nr:hypothetical protein RI543_003368 [Kazachstania heterogenica]
MSVIIEPDFLEYYKPLAETSTAFITIHNQTDEIKAFKIKTTAPKLYCVRPNAAIIQPGENVKISVIFLGLPQEPLDDYKCKDKFLVIVLPAPYKSDSSHAVSEIWNDLENEFKSQAIQKKIKVVYNNSNSQTLFLSTNGQDSHETKNQNMASVNNVNQLEQKAIDKQVTLEKDNTIKENIKKIKINTMGNETKSSSPAREPQQNVTAKISPSTMLFITIISYWTKSSVLIYLLLTFLNVGGMGQILSNFVGFIIPTINSIKALKTRNDQSDDQFWLSYWIIFGFLNVVEFWSSTILYLVPFYWVLKVLFLLLISVPSTGGCQWVYSRIIEPSYDQLLKKLTDVANKNTSMNSNISHGGVERDNIRQVINNAARGSGASRHPHNN